MSNQLHLVANFSFFIYHVKMIDVNVSKVLKEFSTNFCSFCISKWLPLEQDL